MAEPRKDFPALVIAESVCYGGNKTLFQSLLYCTISYYIIIIIIILIIFILIVSTMLILIPIVWLPMLADSIHILYTPPNPSISESYMRTCEMTWLALPQLYSNSVLGPSSCRIIYQIFFSFPGGGMDFGTLHQWWVHALFGWTS